MRKARSQWLIPVLLAFASAAALSLYWRAINRPQPVAFDPPAPVAPTAPAAKPASPGEPQHPIGSAAEPAADQPLPPLPELADSDAVFLAALSAVLGAAAVTEWIAEDGVIERIAATTDGLARDHVAVRIRPILRVSGPFVARPGESSGEFILDPANYQRYDRLVQLLATTDLVRLNDLYRRFYPLFQQAYAELGYPDAYFNDRLVAVIDVLLATPQREEPVRLLRPHVLYEYAEPALQQASAGQKLLLRMGPQHLARIKPVLREFRGLITASAVTATSVEAPGKGGGTASAEAAQVTIRDDAADLTIDDEQTAADND